MSGAAGGSGDRIAANVARVRERVAAAALRARRSTAEVTLVAVTKTVGAGVFPALLAAGVRDVGENRALAAVEKAAQAPPGLRWHLIGHLQTNKARKAATLFDVIHSVDSARLASTLDAELERAGRSMDAFVEVNSGEEQKGGLRAGELGAFWEAVQGLKRLRWAGLMTMAPLLEDPEGARPHFRLLRELRDEWRGRVKGLDGLSMGMTGDFEVAVEEGATHVRVGRALFEGVEPA